MKYFYRCYGIVKMNIKELIEILQQYSPDAETKILDADTGWVLPLHYAGDDEAKIKEYAQDPITKEDMEENTIYFVTNYFMDD